MEDKWQDNLRGAFDAYTESAPDGLWEGVQGGLVRVRRRRRAAAWLSGASAFAFALAGVFFLLRPAVDDELSLTGRPALSELSSMYSPVPELDSPVEIRMLSRFAPVQGSQSVPEQRQDNDVRQPVPAGGDEVSSVSADSAPEPLPDLFDDVPASSAVRPRRDLSVRFSVSGAPAFSSSAQGYRALRAADMLSVLSAYNREGVFQTRSSASDSDFWILDNSLGLNSSTRHWQPVSLELMASRELARGFFVSAGVNYSLLVSDFSSGSSSVRYDTRQTLHYLGLPLSAGVSFPLSGNLELSLAAGGMVSKCVYGISRSDCSIAGESRWTESQSLSIAPLLWSARASAALGWKFSPAFGLFVRPGVTYCFDDGSTVSTIYKDRPLSFDLAFGLRLYL